MVSHSPRFNYDCDRCQYHWCCGPSCACLLGLGRPPRKRRRQVVKALKILNPGLSEAEIMREEFGNA